MSGQFPADIVEGDHFTECCAFIQLGDMLPVQFLPPGLVFKPAVSQPVAPVFYVSVG